MRVKRAVSRAVLATAATAAVLVASTTAAHAAEENWLWETESGNNIGTGAYDDSGDIMRVNDQEPDGHSLLLDVWKVGEPDGIHIRCWDSTGSDAPGVYCSDAFAGSGWGANAKLRGKLCIGEAGPGSGGGRVLRCQPEGQWKTFYR